MTEILEVLAPPAMHKQPNDKCPFCLPPEPIKYTTYPGVKNNSTHFADIMEGTEVGIVTTRCATSDCQN
jgi:hypothetical protein